MQVICHFFQDMGAKQSELGISGSKKNYCDRQLMDIKKNEKDKQFRKKTSNDYIAGNDSFNRLYG